MRQDTPGWEWACPVAEGWFSPAPFSAAFVQPVVFPSSYLREARLLGTAVFVCYTGIKTSAPTSGKAPVRVSGKRDFDVAELLCVLAEISQEEPHIPR